MPFGSFALYPGGRKPARLFPFFSFLSPTLAAGLILLLGSFLNAMLYTAAPVYCFYLASGVSVFVLRRREPQIDRPYRAPAAAVIVFAGVCAFLIYSAITYKPMVALAALGRVVRGLPAGVSADRPARAGTRG